METKNVKTLKNELKDLAAQITTTKEERKTVNFTGERTIKSNYSWLTDAQEAAFVVARLKREFRYRHVAYCMLRSKTLEQIENHNRDTTENLDMFEVKRIMKEYDWSPEEKAAFVERRSRVAEVA